MGRGLFLSGYASWGEELWLQRPLVHIQSPSSRRCMKTCAACMHPLGTLATQLQHMGFPIAAGAEDILVTPTSSPASRGFIPCGGDCQEAFCGDACREWALLQSPHAVLCGGRLGPSAHEALQRLESLALASEQEGLLLLAHHIAKMVLELQRGLELSEVLHQYVLQFATSAWDHVAEAQVADSSEIRSELLTKAQSLLREIFADYLVAGPLLERDLLCRMLGTYDVVNMCVTLENPLNEQGEAVASLLPGDLLAKICDLQQTADTESDDEAEESAEEGGSKDKIPCTAEEGVEAAQGGVLFADIVGSALCEALAFMNHSCLPNCKISFETGSSPDSHGPGLWMSALARRPLMPGDEVLMSYVPSVVGKPLEARQQRLKKTFGFSCSCRPCISDKMLLTQMDEAT